MAKGEDTPGDAVALRRQAEERLRNTDIGVPQSAEDVRRLVHELQVHQIELEMQNEELRRARDEVEAGLEKYADLYDFSPVGYFSLDRQGTIHAVNLTGAALIGVGRANLLNRRFQLHLDVGDLAEFSAFLAKACTSQAKESCELPLRQEGGRLLYVRMEATALAAGQSCRVAIIDITTRRQTEDALHESEARFRAVFERAAIGMVLMDTSGVLVLSNRAFQQFVDYEAEELARMTFLQVIHPDDATGDWHFFQEMVAGQRDHDQVEKRFLCRNGRQVWGHLTVSLARDASGQSQFVIGMVVDITARREAELARDRLLAQLRDLAEVLQETNAHLQASLADSERRRAEVSALLAGSRAVLGARDFEGAARSVFRACKDLIGAQAGYVALLNPAGTQNDVVFLDAGDLPCTVDPALPMPVRGLRESAYRSGQVVYDNTFGQSEWLAFMPPGHAPLDNVLFAPLVAEGQVMGLLGLANKPHGFDADDARMAAAFGELCTIALLNSRVLGALADSEARFRALFRALPVGVSILDGERHVVDANLAMERMLGLTREELLAGRYSRRQYLRPDGTLMPAAEFPSSIALREQRVVEGVEVGLRDIDGTLRWASVSAVPFGSPDWRIIVTTVDLTERKRAEQALLEANERLALAQRSAGAGIWDWDMPTGQLDWSPEFFRLFGLAPGTAPSFDVWRAALHHEDRQVAEERITAAIRDHVPLTSEYRVVLLSGAVRWIAALGNTTYDERGEPRRMAGICMDITERKGAEAEREVLLAQVQRERAHAQHLADALETERDTLDAVIAAMVESMLIYDAQGRIVKANPAARKVYGLDPVGVSTQELFERVQVRRLDGTSRSYEELPRTRALRGETVTAERQRVRNALGREYTVLATAAPLLAQGEIVGAVVVWHDVTELDRAAVAREEHLRRHGRLVAVATEVLAEHTTEGVLGCVVDAARELTGARIGMAGHGYRNGRFEVGLSSRAEGVAECPPGTQFGIERGGVYLDLIDKVTSICLTDAQLRQHPAWWGLPEGHAALCGLLGARLAGRDNRALGMIMVSDKSQGDFDEEDEALLTQLAVLTSLGLQHIEARAEAERRAREAEEGRNQLLVAQESLRRAHDQLESKVRERTAELQSEILERRRAEEDATRRSQELATLNALAAAVGSSLDLPEVLASLKALMSERLETFGGAIFSHSATDDRLYLQTSWGLPLAVLARLQAADLTTPASEGDAADLAQLPQDQCAPHEPIARGTPFAGLALDLSRAEWPSYLRVQLMAKGVLEGAAYLFKQTPGPFGEAQVAFFRAAAQPVGMAMQNARLFEQVRADQEQLRTLSRRLVEIQEAERRHIARELHDEIGQVLTSLKMSLQVSRRLSAEAASVRLDEALANANALMARVRDLSLHLRPPMLDDLGLLATLLWHLQTYAEETGIVPQLKHSGLEQRFSADIETAAYRIVQEALTNVARHAGVTEVVVRLWADQDSLCVQVEDRGLGFDPAMRGAGTDSSGLIGMRERAVLLGGQLTVESSPGTGTRVTAELPLHR